MKKTIFAVFVIFAMCLVAQETIPLPLTGAFRDSTVLEAGPTKVLTPRYAYFLGVASPQAFSDDMPDCWTACLGLRVVHHSGFAEYAMFIHVPEASRGKIAYIVVNSPASGLHRKTYIIPPGSAAERVIVLILPDVGTTDNVPTDVIVYSKGNGPMFQQDFDIFQRYSFFQDIAEVINNTKD